MKLDHQPYKDWILSRTALNKDQAEALQKHLNICESCRELSNAWLEVEKQLQLAPVVSPEPGFANRWMARLEAEYQRQRRQQTFLIMLFSVGGAAVLAFVLGLWFFPLVRNPGLILLAWGYETIGIILSLNTYVDVFGTLVRTIFSVVPEPVWLAIVVGLCALGALWIIAYQKFTSVRRASL